MSTPSIDRDVLISSPGFWMATLGSAIAEGDEDKARRCQEELRDLNWIVLSPDQVQALGQFDDDQAEGEAQEAKP